MSCVDDELEAIKAVLSEDFNLITDDVKDKNDAYTHCFEAYCFPTDDLDESHVSVQLRIKIPTKYPSVIPSIEILSKNGISQSIADNLLKHLNDKLVQLLDQEMLYEIIDLTREYLKEFNYIGNESSDDQKCKQQTEGIEDDNGDFDDDDADFGSDDGAWDDMDEYADDATLQKSLASIEKIIENEEKQQINEQNNGPKDTVLTFDDVIDGDITCPKLLAVADVQQLATTNQHFYAECRAINESINRFEVRIGVKMSDYICSESMLNVIGLSVDDYIVIRMDFDNEYTHNAKAPKIIQIGKSVPHKKFTQTCTPKKEKEENAKCEAIKLKNKLQSFVGGRSVMNRITNKLFARLWPPTHLNEHIPANYKQILQLMAVTNYNFIHCKETLHKLKSYEKALMFLSNDQNEQIEGSVAKKKKKRKMKIDKNVSNLCDKLVFYGMNEIFQKNESKIGEQNDCINEQLKHFVIGTNDFFLHNVLCQILYFALHSILTLSKRCLVCDLEFPVFSGLIKPTVCNNTLCLYGYEELEIGLDIASLILQSPQIVDLLITFFVVAAKRNKVNSHGLINLHGLAPNEDINFKLKWKQSDNPYDFSQEPQEKEYNVLDFEKVRKVIAKMPSMDTLTYYAKKGGNKMIAKSLSFRSPLLWPLLRWIIVTNRSHLVPLKSKKLRFDGLPNCFQFEFVSYSAEREYMFERLSIKNNDCGYLWAWHGSPMLNWHSILRNGLKNYSNTKNMKNGAVYGNGIYLAPHSGTSYWYCETNRSDTWNLSMFNQANGDGLYCLALCQILNHPKLRAPEPYYVVPSESWVMIRYLFVFNTVPGKKNNWRGKGKYFDIAAEKLMKNYKKKQAGF